MVKPGPGCWPAHPAAPAPGCASVPALPRALLIAPGQVVHVSAQVHLRPLRELQARPRVTAPSACPASLAAPGRTCPHTAPAHPSASRSRGGFPHPAGDRGRRSRPRRWSAGSAPQAAQGGVLPAPLGPRNPNTAPGSTARSSPQTPTWPCGQILVSARARITDMAGPTGLRHRPVPSSCQRDLTAVAERPATSGRRAQPVSPMFMRR